MRCHVLPPYRYLTTSQVTIMLLRLPTAIASPLPQPICRAGGAQVLQPPIPPWQQSGAMPPGIMLAAQPPLDFQPFIGTPRPPGAPPFERLLLISSHVHEPMRVAAAALPNVAVVVYDWKHFTLQELVRYIKKAIGPAQQVMSLAVAAPGHKPGGIGGLQCSFGGCYSHGMSLSL